MLNQSKTAHQAEIDAACETIDFLRFNAQYLVRIYEEQPISSPGVWNRLEYRPLEGFVFAISPFNFTAIGANLTTSPGADGEHGRVEAGLDAGALRLVHAAASSRRQGSRRASINLVFGPGAELGTAALTSPELAGVHFTGSTGVFQSIWQTIGGGIERYRNYPRIVGETGGKDFILAHPSADPAAVATAIVRGSFEYQGQKCSASSRLYLPSNLWHEIRASLERDVPSIAMGDPRDFTNFMGAVIDESSFETQARGDRRGPRGRRRDRRRRRHRRQHRAGSSSRP